MRDNFITPAGVGDARVIDVHLSPFASLFAASPSGQGIFRDGLLATGPNIFDTSSNWGFGGETPSRDIRNGAACWKIRQGAVFFDYRIPLVVTQPSFRTWRTGLYVVEFFGSWTTTVTGTDCGFVMTWNDNLTNQRPINALQQGWSIRADTGQLMVSHRGAVGLTNTNLQSVGADVTAWQKIRVEVRHATSSQQATVQVIVNNSNAAAYTLAGNDANFPPIAATGSATNQALTIGFGSASATEYFYFRDVAFWCGPNTSIGM